MKNFRSIKNKFLKIFCIGIFAWVGMAMYANVSGHELICADREEIETGLKKEAGMIKVVVALSNGGKLYEFITSSDQTNFLIHVSTDKQRVCLLDGGEVFKVIDNMPEPKPHVPSEEG